MIKFYDLTHETAPYKDELIQAATTVISSGWYILGEQLANFETNFAAFIGVDHCIGVANGLDALTLCLRAIDIGPGDEVIVPAQTFVATWLAVSATGAKIVPVDVTQDACLLDPEQLAQAITANTKAIVPVHLFGHPVDIDAIADIAAGSGQHIHIFEDSAQAHGATYKGRKCGALASASGFSFYPSKTLGALGDGGAITTNDEALATRIRALRNYGSSEKYVHDHVGVNSRLDELQAAFLDVKLRHLAADIRKRQDIAARYDELLTDTEAVTPINPSKDVSHAYHLYVVRTAQRERVASALQQAGIESLVHYPIPPFAQAAYSHLNIDPQGFPVSSAWATECLSLPIGPQMNIEDVDVVVDCLNKL